MAPKLIIHLCRPQHSIFHQATKMQFEVEQKFAVESLAETRERFRDMGAEDAGEESQIDLYLAHPSRDFAQTDEAFRLRQIGDELLVTYKGPKLKGDAKTRREIELPLGFGNGAFESHKEMYQLLGFKPVAEVRKRRAKATLTYNGRVAHIAFDQVEKVGSFVEVEMIADESELAEVQNAVASLTQQAGLHEIVRESYLELLLAISPADNQTENR